MHGMDAANAGQPASLYLPHSWHEAKKSPASNPLVAMTAMAALMALPHPAFAGPTGGTVVEGSAGISQVGTTTNINQSSNKAIINWQGFSIAPRETVNFNQPSSASATLNRVTGNETSVISGALNANGQVFLVNSAGVLFNKGAQVNVGGLVASTLDISNGNFMAGNYSFSGTSAASIVNQGKIKAGDGGYVALLGKTVSNDGVISAKLGTVAMASGNKITLNFDGNSLIDVTIDEGALNALVENKRAVKADGGRVILTAKAADAVLSAQVNNSGIIQARTMAVLQGGSGARATVHVGSIKLLASGGTVKVAGKLDASAPKGGKSGTIETSGNKVQVASNATITTKAASGTNGTWLIDPTDFTITSDSAAQTASGIGATTLLSNLEKGNVTIVTSSAGTQSGDINVNAALDWSATSATPSTNSLTLGAYNNINVNSPITWSAGTLTLNAGANVYVNAVMTATGTANFAANYGHVLDASGNVTTTANDIGYGAGLNGDHTPMGLYTLTSAANASTTTTFLGPINFSGTGSVTLNGQAYQVINSAADLTGITMNGDYVLGSAITLSTWTAPLGSATQPFTGSFNGFGHQISLGNETSGVGLFGTIGAGGTVSNLAVSESILPNPNNTGKATSPATINTASLGMLADVNHGGIFNSHVSGIVDVNQRLTTGSPTNATIDDVGGFVGDNYGTIANSYSTASPVQTTLNAGGFVGVNEPGGQIYGSSVTASGANIVGYTSGIAYTGGFAGVNAGTISQSSTTYGVSLTGAALTGNAISGGFAGLNQATGTIDQSYVSPSLSSGTGPYVGVHVGGFVGENDGAITNSYSSIISSVSAYSTTSFLDAGFAYINKGTISTSYAYNTVGSGANTSKPTYGFVETNSGTIQNDYWYVVPNSSYPLNITGNSATALTASSGALPFNKLNSYTSFNANVWGSATSGLPILTQLPVYISSSTAFGTVYGTPATSTGATTILNSLAVQGLQNGDTSKFSFTTIPGSGYFDAGTYNVQSTLTLPVYQNVTGNFLINPVTLKIASTGGVVANKVYDGTTTGTIISTLANDGLTGLVGGQNLTVGYNAQFGSPNVGSNQSVTVTYTLANGTGITAGKASNYTILPSRPTKASITLATLTLAASDKTYDGTATATLGLSGEAPADVQNKALLFGYTAQFGDANAGQNKAVTATGLSLSGTSASNYTLMVPNSLMANILPKPITVFGNEASAVSTAVGAANLTVTNAVGGDNIGLGGSVLIASTAGGKQPITDVSGLTIGNPNYTLPVATSSGGVNSYGTFVIGSIGNLALDTIGSGTTPGQIVTSGNTTTITTADKAIIDWLSFTIPADQTVKFVQAAATSVVLNEVTGSAASKIDGALNANGRVFILNPNGIIFSSAAQVNVGALVASTLSMNNSDFTNGNYALTASTGSGSVSSAGYIKTADGGFAALVSRGGVSQTGILNASGGDALIVAADGLTLNLSATTPGLSSLSGYKIGTLDGTASVGGTLNLASTSGGTDGLLETAGVLVSPLAGLDLKAGTNGTWSLTENSLLIGSPGNFSGQSITGFLANTNLALNAANGDVTIGDPVSWSANTKLTLNSAGVININQPVTATGASAAVALNYSGADYNIAMPTTATSNDGGSLTLPGAGLSINGHAYTLIHSMGDLASVSSGYYALVQNLDAGGTVYTGSVIPSFTGTFAGLGHTISNLTINDTVGQSYLGFFGKFGFVTFGVPTTDTLRDIGLLNTNITSNNGGRIGALAGYNGGIIENAYASGGQISAGARGQTVGGLVGYNIGTINNSYAAVDISGLGYLGGLVGNNDNGTISNSHASGNVTGAGIIIDNGNGLVPSSAIGGLVGFNNNLGTVGNSYATGSVSGTNSSEIGGLVGSNSGLLDNVTASGKISAAWYSTAINGQDVGGIAGVSYGNITNATANTTISLVAGPNTFISYVGGIAGGFRSLGNGTPPTIGNSVSNANISFTGNVGVDEIAGGVVGTTGPGLTNSVFNGTINDLTAQAAAEAAAAAAAQAAAEQVAQQAAQAAAEAAAQQAAQAAAQQAAQAAAQAAARQAVQQAAGVANASVKTATENLSTSISNPELLAVGGTPGAIFTPADLEKNITVLEPATPPTPATPPAPVADQRERRNTSAPAAQKTGAGSKGNGGLGATIESIEINGERFNLQNKDSGKSTPGPVSPNP
jgi:filamentous hemagglutinin family protein